MPTEPKDLKEPEQLFAMYSVLCATPVDNLSGFLLLELHVMLQEAGIQLFRTAGALLRGRSKCG